jgi:CBS domain-containing protein/nucleotide-binding universal stress UspA family protein
MQANPSDLLMQTGRPLLVVPDACDWLDLRSALIAWKDTPECRRAAVDALPILREAKDVIVAEIVEDEADRSAAASGVEDLVAWLSRHGVLASGRAPSEPDNAAAQLDEIASEVGAGLVVAGAYGHSRFRDWVFRRCNEMPRQSVKALFAAVALRSGLISIKITFAERAVMSVPIQSNQADRALYRFLEQIASDSMTPIVKTVSRNLTLRELEDLFEQDDFNAYPVEEDSRIVGLVSKFDFLASFAFTTARMTPRYDDLMKRTVADIMTPDFIYVGGETRLTRVLQLMIEHRIRSIPVIEGDQRLVGMISREDVMRALQRCTGKD